MVTPAERPPIGIGRRLLFTVLAVAGVFVILESGLRLAGFRHPTTVESMAFTFPIDDYNRGQPVPFLDHEFVELCAQIPPQVKMHRLEEKHDQAFSDKDHSTWFYWGMHWCGCGRNRRSEVRR